MDTKERRTPVRRPVQSAGPELASGTAACGKIELIKTAVVSRASAKISSQPPRRQMCYSAWGLTSIGDQVGPPSTHSNALYGPIIWAFRLGSRLEADGGGKSQADLHIDD